MNPQNLCKKSNGGSVKAVKIVGVESASGAVVGVDEVVHNVDNMGRNVKR